MSISILRPKWVLISDYASLSTDGKVSVSGIFEELNAPQMPATSPQLFLSGSFTGEPKSNHLLSLRIVPPSGKDILTVGSPQKIILGENGKLSLVLGIGGFVFKEFGNYKLEIIEKGKALSSIDLMVKETNKTHNLNGKN